jgi:hypothetical protein
VSVCVCVCVRMCVCVCSCVSTSSCAWCVYSCNRMHVLCCCVALRCVVLHGQCLAFSMHVQKEQHCLNTLLNVKLTEDEPFLCFKICRLE